MMLYGGDFFFGILSVLVPKVPIEAALRHRLGYTWNVELGVDALDYIILLVTENRSHVV